MDIFEQHEAFGVEALDKMNSAKLLGPLVFGGGTMLRLCLGGEAGSHGVRIAAFPFEAAP